MLTEKGKTSNSKHEIFSTWLTETVCRCVVEIQAFWAAPFRATLPVVLNIWKKHWCSKGQSETWFPVPMLSSWPDKGGNRFNIQVCKWGILGWWVCKPCQVMKSNWDDVLLFDGILKELCVWGVSQAEWKEYLLMGMKLDALTSVSCRSESPSKLGRKLRAGFERGQWERVGAETRGIECWSWP